MTRRTSASLPWLLLPLAALRVTRLITTDTLPEALFIGRLRARAALEERKASEAEWLVIDGIRPPYSHWAQENDRTRTVWGHLIKGFDCPFCIPFWAGAALIVVTAFLPKPLHKLWNVTLGALALNYVTGHVSKRID